MDGNGRWAKRRGLASKMGDRRGVDALKEVFTLLSRLGCGSTNGRCFFYGKLGASFGGSRFSHGII